MSTIKQTQDGCGFFGQIGDIHSVQGGLVGDNLFGQDGLSGVNPFGQNGLFGDNPFGQDGPVDISSIQGGLSGDNPFGQGGNEDEEDKEDKEDNEDNEDNEDCFRYTPQVSSRHGMHVVCRPDKLIGRNLDDLSIEELNELGLKISGADSDTSRDDTSVFIFNGYPGAFVPIPKAQRSKNRSGSGFGSGIRQLFTKHYGWDYCDGQLHHIETDEVLYDVFKGKITKHTPFICDFNFGSHSRSSSVSVFDQQNSLTFNDNSNASAQFVSNVPTVPNGPTASGSPDQLIEIGIGIGTPNPRIAAGAPPDS